MHFNPDLSPETRKSRNPAENKNHGYIVQAMLMGKSPEGEEGWVARHAATFRELYSKDEVFRDLVNAELTDENLNRIQERLHDEERR